MGRYDIVPGLGHLAVVDGRTDYKLRLVYKGNSFAKLSFSIPGPGGRVAVTGRDTNRYLPPGTVSYGETLFSRDSKVLEIGAGYGGLISALVLAKPIHRPTVCDSFMYDLGQDMLEFAKEERLGTEHHQLIIRKFLFRGRIITDPKRVNLITCRLSDLLNLHPELEETFDEVVDLAAARFYARVSDDLFHDIKKRLLKPGRILRTY